jgi:hypothetical protein
MKDGVSSSPSSMAFLTLNLLGEPVGCAFFSFQKNPEWLLFSWDTGKDADASTQSNTRFHAHNYPSVPKYCNLYQT